jgi:hypothetical protein
MLQYSTKNMVASDKTSTLSLAVVRSKVIRALGVDAVKEIIAFVKKKQPSLWGAEKTRNFDTQAIYLGLYHDITGTGYTRLNACTRSWHNVDHKSVHHNTKVIRHKLEEWGKKQIVLGDVGCWNQAATYFGLANAIKDANLRIDSTDMRKIGKSRTSKKSRDWSSKENSPAQRYMSIVDGRGRTVKLWGGYSPKLYDGDFLKMKRKFFERKLGEGAVILGDNHFSEGLNFKKCKFYVNPKDKKQRDPEEKGKRLSTLTKEQKSVRKAIAQARAAVESPFGVIKNRFKILGQPFMESNNQQDALVTFALGHHNYVLRKRK